MAYGRGVTTPAGRPPSDTPAADPPAAAAPAPAGTRPPGPDLPRTTLRDLPLPLDGAVVDRAAHRRAEPDLVRTLRAQPTTRVLLVHRGRLALAGPTPADGVALLGPADVAAVDPVTDDEHARWLFLGEEGGAAYVALVLPDDADAEEVDIEGVDASDPFAVLARERHWSGLRELVGGLGAPLAGLATEAVALAAWHANHTRCPRCGGRTTVENGGWTRRCVAQGIELYPRTDPAVIMTVVHGEGDDERLLLGHAAHWPERRFSTLAGYVEPGESLESAVRREVAEEVGVVVGDVAYRGSQPWPFPASLMLGFAARALTTELRPDGVELTDARWFTRPGLAEAVRAGDVLLPGRASIARALVEDWFGGRLPDA
ncbi:NAD+ diphosphatase [Cellulosimicrobium cellulans J34]|nr:NAD+ diphosphatase [Cellulosimicrobium cellulans J34]SMF44987.1 NAD+ diphosphatase [Cellulosimicrobium cellulans J1]